MCMVFYSQLLMGSESEYLQYVNKITSHVAAQIEKEFDLACTSEGGSMPYNVASIYLGFDAKRRATLEEARLIHVRCTEMLLKAVNEDEKIRPFLAEYPFPSHRINISIGFLGSEFLTSDGTIALTSGAREKVFYKIRHPIENCIDSFYEEPYADALKIAQESQLTNADLRIHHGKPYEVFFDDFMKAVTKEISLQWGFKCLNAGGNIRDGIQEVAFSFIKNKRISLEQGRKWEIEITDFLMNRINNDKNLKPYLKDSLLKEDSIRVRLLFGENEFRPFRDGHSLYEILPSKGHILYRGFPVEKPNEGTLLTPGLIADESYDESRQHLQISKKQK